LGRYPLLAVVDEVGSTPSNPRTWSVSLVSSRYERVDKHVGNAAFIFSVSPVGGRLLLVEDVGGQRHL
jgi:hypothetical protein